MIGSLFVRGTVLVMGPDFDWVVENEVLKDMELESGGVIDGVKVVVFVLIGKARVTSQ